MCSRIPAVIAKRKSESMLILQTANLAACLSCCSGTPTASTNLPPFSLMILTYSWLTEDEPCKTIGNPGSLLLTSSKMSNLNGGGNKIPVSGSLVHCSGLNLYAPWLVPIAIANESQPVLRTNSSTSSGFV